MSFEYDLKGDCQLSDSKSGMSSNDIQRLPQAQATEHWCKNLAIKLLLLVCEDQVARFPDV